MCWAKRPTENWTNQIVLDARMERRFVCVRVYVGVLMKSLWKCHSERELNCSKMLFTPRFSSRNTKTLFPRPPNCMQPFCMIFSLAGKRYKLFEMPRTNAITRRVDNPNFDLSFDVMWWGNECCKVAAKMTEKSPSHLYIHEWNIIFFEEFDVIDRMESYEENKIEIIPFN